MEGEDSRIKFTNAAPEDKEWSAHIKLLNEWTMPERYLHDILQYARSGEFYPADMHVDLIEQVISHHIVAVLNELSEQGHGGGNWRRLIEQKREQYKPRSGK